MEKTKLNLFEKIQAVSNKVKNIEKNMVVGTGRYSYKAVSDIDVVLAVKEAETKYKLTSIPIKQELVKSDNVEVLKENGAKTITYVDIVKMTLRIVDLEDTDKFIDIESFGRGLDSGDKGFGKASTYARKYALLNAYKIATGEDPDADKSVEQRVPNKDEKREIIKDYMLKNSTYANNVHSFFHVNSVDELEDKDVNSVYNNLRIKGLIR